MTKIQWLGAILIICVLSVVFQMLMSFIPATICSVVLGVGIVLVALGGDCE